MLCRELNKALREEKRDLIKPFFPFLKLLLSALYKLPLRKLTLFRGEKRAVDLDSLEKDMTYVWWSITSCSLELKVRASASDPFRLMHKTQGFQPLF